MPEPSDVLDIAELPDEEGKFYLIGVDANHSERMMDVLGNRIEAVFDHATFLVVAGQLGAEADIILHELGEADIDDIEIDQVTKENLKEIVDNG